MRTPNSTWFDIIVCVFGVGAISTTGILALYHLLR